MIIRAYENAQGASLIVGFSEQPWKENQAVWVGLFGLDANGRGFIAHGNRTSDKMPWNLYQNRAEVKPPQRWPMLARSTPLVGTVDMTELDKAKGFEAVILQFNLSQLALGFQHDGPTISPPRPDMKIFNLKFTRIA